MVARGLNLASETEMCLELKACETAHKSFWKQIFKWIYEKRNSPCELTFLWVSDRWLELGSVEAEDVLNKFRLAKSPFVEKLWLFTCKALGVILSESKLSRKNLLLFEISSSSRFLLVKLSMELDILDRESLLIKLCLVWGWLNVNEEGKLPLLSCDLSGEKRARLDFSNLFTNCELTTGCWITTALFSKLNEDLAGLWNSCLLEVSLDGPGLQWIWASVLKNWRFAADEVGVLFFNGVVLLGLNTLRFDFLVAIKLF